MYAHYMQNAESDCGIAAIRTILEQLKCQMKDSQELYRYYKMDKTQGLSLSKLKDILMDFGIQSNAYGVDEFEAIKKVEQFPIVLVVENDGMAHYILVHDIKGSTFTISDPAESEVKVYEEEYIKSIFLGYALCIENYEKNLVVPSNKRKIVGTGDVLYNEIMQNISRFKKIKMVALMILKYILPLVITIVMQIYMEKNQAISYAELIFPICISLVLIVTFYSINKLESKQKAQIENMMQEKVLIKYYHQKMEDIYSGKNIENISGYFWNLFYSVSGLLEKFYLSLNITYLLSLLIFLGILNINLMLLIMVWGALFSLYLVKQIKEIKNTEKDIIGKSSVFFQSVEDNIRNSFDIHLYGKKNEAGNFVENKMENYFGTRLRSVRNSTRVSSMYEFFNVMILISAFVFLALDISGTNSVSLLNASNSILIISMILGSVSPVVQTWLNYETSKVAIDHIQSSNDYQDYSVQKEIEILPFNEISQLKLMDISFNYGEKEVIKKFSAVFKAGKVYGVFGGNGAGKSTLVKLVSGILSPKSGSITINQNLIKNTLNSTNMSEFISMYSSECGLYRNSLIRNIQFKVFNEELSQAEKRTYNDLFSLELPGSYLIQNEGNNLSQGQKQKILLMRTFFSEKSIYIFDEPTGNLDYQSKEILKQEISKLAEKGKIVLLISHEEDVLAIADEVVIL